MPRRPCGRLVLAMMTAAVIGALSACGAKDYSEPQACGVKSSAIADVVGTKAFTVDSNDAKLPLDGDRTTGTGAYVCRVDVEGKRTFSVTIEIESASTITERRESIAKSSHRFARAGGVGRVQAAEKDSKFVYGMWVCGDVGVMVNGNATKTPRTGDTIALVKKFADVAGCWSAS